MSEVYSMVFSSSYTEGTHWPRVETLTAVFYQVDIQRLRLHTVKRCACREEFLGSESGLSGSAPASELADQSGSQT